MFRCLREAARSRLSRPRTRQYETTTNPHPQPPTSTTTAPLRKQPQPKRLRDSRTTDTPPKSPSPAWRLSYRLSDRTSRYALYLVNSFLVLHLLTTYVGTVKGCEGPSMIPTIAWDGDWVVLSKLHRYGKDIEVGDLVSYRHPVRQGITGIKRVVGMPGDFVLRDTPQETYALEKDDERENWMIQVPEGHCWLVGDNLDASRDSRHFGPLPLALVRGKVVARFWPNPAWFENGLKDIET